MMRAAAVSLLFGAASAAASVPLVTFDGAAGTTFKFTTLNDPVMGGQSNGNWTLSSEGGMSFGVLDGEVKDVPSLKAPGFFTGVASGKFNDASAAAKGGMKLTVRSSTSEYTGFQLSFAAGTLSPEYSCAGGGSAPLSRGCFKAHFSVTAGTKFSEVYVPFNTFSDKWDPKTGKQTTTCADDKDVCPTADKLAGIKRVEFWAEGADGHAKLDILKVEAVDESAAAVKSTGMTALPLVTFDGKAGTTFGFKQLNDPVMGGKSSGNWSVKASDGVMQGIVVNVPSLSAPGFIKAAGDGKFNDVSAALEGGLRLTVRSPTSSYTGFRLAFAAGTLSPDYSCAGGGSIPLSRGCFKREFAVKGGSEFSEVYLPFNTFSDKWSPATGKQTSTCADDKDVCPTAENLAGIKRIEFWAEGVDGAVELDVKSVEAVYGAALSTTVNTNEPPLEFNRCSQPIQDNLRFGISGRNTTAGTLLPVDENETLAAAVCCDSRLLPYAEPRFLFQAPDILLMSKLDQNGTTTWYDSSCGVPLFKSPVGRNFTAFEEDTKEHGWPSFRTAEVVTENVMTNKTSGYVTSKCGTHLGSYLPDEQGPRWCIDLSCVSGVRAQKN